MGYIFEELIRRFSEAHNEDAGQHYTPREVIELMTELLFIDDEDIQNKKECSKSVYDQTTPNMIQRIIGIFERKPLISKEI